MAALNLAARFLVAELGALLALAWWGASLGGARGVVLAVAAPLAVALVWWRWVAPRAVRRLRDPARLVLELLVFGAATAALAAVGHPVVAAAYALCAVVTAGLVRVWPEPAGRHP